MQSVQLRDPVQTQYIFTQRKYPFADFWTQVTRKLSFIPEYEHKTQENAQKTQMDIVLLFFSQKTIEQCQNKLRTSQKPWENDSAAQMIKESTEIAEFYLENKRKSKKTQCSSSENPLEESHFEMNFPWKLEGT